LLERNGQLCPCGTREVEGHERGREGGTGGGLLEMADMSRVFSNFVKKFVWGHNT
jgi:hypothetical protein